MVHRLDVCWFVGVTESPGSEARFAVARSLTPKDYKILNYCCVDPISNLELHLGLI